MDRSAFPQPKGLLIGLALGVWLLGIPLHAFASDHIDIQPGSEFPDIRFESLLAAEDYAALGLPRREGPFSLSEIPGDVLVLEFFNKNCVPCQRQVRSVQAFFEHLETDGLAHQIRVLGVAAGNQAKYLQSFRAKRGLRFPITADPSLERWRTFGRPGKTPFAVVLLRRGGRWVLGDAHVGVKDEMWFREETLGHASGQRPVELETPEAEQAGIPRSFGPEREQQLAERLLMRLEGRPIVVEPFQLPEGPSLYRAVGTAGKEGLYVWAGRRAPLCEICTGVYFLFAFDGNGRVRGFTPLLVHKWGNEPWTPADARHLGSRLAGRHMAGLAFDEEVDAVSSATISSSIIFDEIRQAYAAVEALLE